ncbi:restriction endonuclease subunit S [Halomonas sp. TRM85114]|nr:restriction endonuclease subunit S [Halomonas jincaotanensis]
MRLEEVCTFKPPKKEARQRLNPDDLVSFVPMNNLGVRKKVLELGEDRTLEEVAGGYTYFADGDVLLAKITPCFENGKLGIASGLSNGVGFGSSEFIVMRPNVELDAEYLFYFLSQDSVRDAGARVMSGAVGHKRVPKEFIEELELPLPELAEQKRIVSLLDEALEGIDTVVANTEKNLTNVRELFESYLNAVEANSQSLGDLVDIRTGKLNANAAVKGGAYPFFTCSRETFKIDKIAFDCEAILLAGNNASGDFNVKHYFGKFNAYQLTYVITIKNEEILLYRYLYFQFVKSLKGLKEVSIGVGTKYLKLGMIKDLKIGVPPIKQQKKIVNILDNLLSDLNRLESIYQQKLAALAELKQSLLQKAFSGELTAREAEAAVEEATA